MLGLNPLSSWAVAASIFGAFTTASISEDAVALSELSDRSLIVESAITESSTPDDSTNYSITHTALSEETVSPSDTAIDAEILIILGESNTASDSIDSGMNAAVAIVESAPSTTYQSVSVDLPVVVYSDLYNTNLLVDRSGRPLIIKKIFR